MHMDKITLYVKFYSNITTDNVMKTLFFKFWYCTLKESELHPYSFIWSHLWVSSEQFYERR
jgi:hypothetical protein